MKVQMKCLLLILAGCGGQPDGLFATALTRVNADGGYEAAQEAACCADVGVSEDSVDAFTPELQAEAGSDVVPVEAGEDVAFDAALPEASLHDATCWPPGACDCPCYRNAAMDDKCPSYERPAAWVCTLCAPAGCAFEYDAQANLACCPK